MEQQKTEDIKDSIPIGECQDGCGQKTKIVNGVPNKYIWGHSTRTIGKEMFKRCKKCNKVFARETTISRNTWEVTFFCSPKCYHEYYDGRERPNLRIEGSMKNCLECQKEFRVTNWDTFRQFCNDECHRKYLFKTSDVSRKKRILERSNFKCEHCGKKVNEKTSILHHTEYQYSEPDEIFKIFCKACHLRLHRKLAQEQKKFNGNNQIARAVLEILKALKINTNDENFRNTPARVSRYFCEMCEGLFCEDEMKEILKTKFPSDYTGMVITKNIVTYSLCPHHLIPVKYTIYVGIIYDKEMLGLSKVGRITELMSKRPVLQEQLTEDVVEIFEKNLNCKGVMCVISGEHGCMHCRGIKQIQSEVITSSIRGNFKNKDVRDEFLSLMKLKVDLNV